MLFKIESKRKYGTDELATPTMLKGAGAGRSRGKVSKVGSSWFYYVHLSTFATFKGLKFVLIFQKMT